MTEIHSFEVIDPPTGGEVKERAFDRMMKHKPLTLTLLGSFAVPKPEPIQVVFPVSRMSTSEDSFTIRGITEAGESVFVAISNDPDQTDEPAWASVVS